jgi:hypothetical protein
MPAGKHPRVGRPIGGERHKLVDYLATLMTFPHTNQQLSSPHDSQVGIAQTGGSRRHGSDRDWIEVLIHPVQTLVPLAAGEQYRARRKVGSPAILMDPRAHIEPGQDGVSGSRIFGPADHHGLAVLGGTGLQPVDGLAAGMDRIVGGCLTGDLLTVDR